MLIANPLNESSLAFPVLECVHIAGFICGVGTAALVDFRLLGMGLTDESASKLWSDTMTWTLGGLTLAVFSGLLLFSIDPGMYVVSYVFRLKMLCLLVAVAFYYTMVRRAARRDSGSIVACISLGLWALVPLCGILIGFSSVHAYPILLWLHVLTLILGVAMVLVTDLRLLGIGMRNYSLSQVVSGLRIPKRIAFVITAICGVLLFGAAGMYSDNPWFWAKGALLALVAVNYAIFRRAVYAGAVKWTRLAAALSILLWTGVVWAGRGPATVKDIMHSMVDPSADFLFQSVQLISDEHGFWEKAPQTTAQWEDVQQRFQVLADAPGILAAPSRRAARPRDRSKNPAVELEPEEVQKLLAADRQDFIRRAQRLHDAASVGMQAVAARDKDALVRALDGIDRACESCHLHYLYPNDKRAQEAAKANGIE